MAAPDNQNFRFAIDFLIQNRLNMKLCNLPQITFGTRF